MLVVWRDSVPDVGAPVPPLQQLERPPVRTIEGSDTGKVLESWRMPACADPCAFVQRRVGPSSDGLPGGVTARS